MNHSSSSVPGRRRSYPTRAEFSRLLKTGALLAAASGLMSCVPPPSSGQGTSGSAEQGKTEVPKADDSGKQPEPYSDDRRLLLPGKVPAAFWEKQ